MIGLNKLEVCANKKVQFVVLLHGDISGELKWELDTWWSSNAGRPMAVTLVLQKPTLSGLPVSACF